MFIINQANVNKTSFKSTRRHNFNLTGFNVFSQVHQECRVMCTVLRDPRLPDLWQSNGPSLRIMALRYNNITSRHERWIIQNGDQWQRVRYLIIILIVYPSYINSKDHRWFWNFDWLVNLPTVIRRLKSRIQYMYIFQALQRLVLLFETFGFFFKL